MITIEVIRQRLIDAIETSGLSRTHLANMVNVKQPAISQYITGKAMPALDTFANLCKVLDVDPAYILGLSD